jgi:hypothetical protein
VSRHLLTCSDPELVLWVGWDDGLGTFFAQVEPPGAAHPDDLLAWIGALPGEVVVAAELAALVARWARLNDAMLDTLEADRRDRR